MSVDRRTEIEVIRGLEERAFNAWPALSTVLASGWVLRFAAGYTKRANSLNALAPECSLVEILPFAEGLYAAAGLPMTVRLSPLADADADGYLAARGFRRLDETIVMTAPLAAGLAVDSASKIAATPTPQWSTAIAMANAVPGPRQAIHDAMLAAIRSPAAFASITEHGEAAAWGIAVAERGMVGLFDIVTDPSRRRQGIGRRLVTSLLAFGAAQGAKSAYLQVVATNLSAIALYRDLGFGEAYRYHYRQLP